MWNAKKNSRFLILQKDTLKIPPQFFSYEIYISFLIHLVTHFVEFYEDDTFIPNIVSFIRIESESFISYKFIFKWFNFIFMFVKY
jgi:hypothetical protein